MTPIRQIECEILKDYILSLEECKTPEKNLKRKESVKLAFDWRLR